MKSLNYFHQKTEYSKNPIPRHVKNLDELIAELDDLISK